MHTRGTLSQEAERFIRTITKAAQPFQQWSFARHLHHAVAVAAARGRADTIMVAADRHKW